VGLVTITSLIGQGGLGWFILRGLSSVANRSTLIITGVALSVVLAIVLDLLINQAGRWLTPWARREA
jgi:osmoprotectant transport system permease protein